jgi:hypothetical protein
MPPVPKEELELLTSPIERRLVGRLFVIGGPLGLAVAIVLSLWVSQLRVTNAVTVQAESQWVPGETLALRVQVASEMGQEVGPVQVTAAVEQGGQRHALPSPATVEAGGVAQGRMQVPSLTPGPATLHLHVEASPFPARDEVIPVEVVSAREPVAARHVVSSSLSQYADDSDPQPEALKIDVRPRGRVIAGFDNELLVRVTDPAGRPWSGPLAVRLVDGEFGSHRGQADDPPLVWEGRTDAAGLAAVRGLLSSEVLRVLVQLRAEADSAVPSADAAVPDAGAAPMVLHARKIELVSFAGAVHLAAEPAVVEPGAALEVLAVGLGAKRSVFVDVYGPAGAWVDTFDPPVQGREPARPWSPPPGLVGLVQLEAYHYTNAPGESTAVARVWVASAEDGSPAASLRAGLSRQRDRLALARTDRTFDATRERGYLDALEQAAASLPPDARIAAERWVLGTLPVEVYGPPLLLRTHERDAQALLEYRGAWIMGLRVFVFGGGALFLVAITVLMLRSQARDASATLAELQSLSQGAEREHLEIGVHQARRATMARGLVVVLVMAVGLVVAVLALEILVWEL